MQSEVSIRNSFVAWEQQRSQTNVNVSQISINTFGDLASPPQSESVSRFPVSSQQSVSRRELDLNRKKKEKKKRKKRKKKREKKFIHIYQNSLGIIHLLIDYQH